MKKCGAGHPACVICVREMVLKSKKEGCVVLFI
jgi:hypothetical protein